MATSPNQDEIETQLLSGVVPRAAMEVEVIGDDEVDQEEGVKSPVSMGTLRGGDGSEEMREATRAALDAGGGGRGRGGCGNLCVRLALSP